MVTEYEVHALWRQVVDVLEESRKFGEQNADNLLDLLGTIDAAGFAYRDQIDALAAVTRTRYSDVLSVASSLQTWVLLEYAKVLGSRETNPDRIIDLLVERWANYTSATIGPDAVGTGFAFAATTITRNDAGDWTTTFRVGDYVVIANAEDVANNGTYGPVTAVSAGVLTIGTAAFTVNASDTLVTFVRPPIRVQSRGMTLATPAAASGNVASSGSIHRLKVDAYGYTFESGWADAKLATVETDASSAGGEIHHEVFLLEGATQSRDLLELHELGSGKAIALRALSHRTANTLANAGFEQVTTAVAVSAGAPQPLTAAPTSWELTSGTIGNVYATTDTYARQLVGVTTPISLQFRANATFRQKLSVNGVKLQPSVPVLCGGWMWANAALSAGTGTLSLGASSIAKDLTTLTDNTWTFVPIALGTASWFRNLNAADLAVTFALTGLAGAGGYAGLDEIILAPGTFFPGDGSYYWAIGGTAAWLRGNSFSWTDTETAPPTGKIQRHLAREYGRYAPHHNTLPTFVEP